MRDESGFVAKPFEEIDLPTVGETRQTVVVTDPEVRATIAKAWRKAAAAPPHLRDLWRDNAAMIELLYETSSRISQILTLRREQVSGGLLRFPGHKGGRPREFPVRGRIAAVLRRLPDRGPYFFPARRGAKKKAHRDNLAAFWDSIAPPGLTPHGLRHSGATAAIYAGESLPAVAARLGHKNLTMVQRVYGHIFRDPIPPLPRAGPKTALTSRLERRADARNQPKTPSRAKGSKPGRKASGASG